MDGNILAVVPHTVAGVAADGNRMKTEVVDDMNKMN